MLEWPLRATLRAQRLLDWCVDRLGSLLLLPCHRRRRTEARKPARSQTQERTPTRSCSSTPDSVNKPRSLSATRCVDGGGGRGNVPERKRGTVCLGRGRCHAAEETRRQFAATCSGCVRGVEHRERAHCNANEPAYPCTGFAVPPVQRPSSKVHLCARRCSTSEPHKSEHCTPCIDCTSTVAETGLLDVLPRRR